MNDHIGNILPDCNYCGNNCANENVREGGFYFHKVKIFLHGHSIVCPLFNLFKRLIGKASMFFSGKKFCK